jgi:Protein of unknown function (DUF3667)
MNCKNCTTALDREYLFCPHCGEPAHPHRLTLTHVIHEFIHAFVHADKGIFLLVKDLAYYPGKAALAYTEGIRKKYFNPVSFLLIAGGLTFFLRYKMGVIQSINNTKLAKYAGEFLHHYTTPIVILMIPLLSLYSWLFFKAAGKNYAENMVMNMYMMGEYHLFSIVVFVLPAWLFPQLYVLFITASFLMLAIYYYFTCKTFFKQATSTTLIKVIVIELLFMITLGLFIGIALVLYLAVFSGLHLKDLK